MAKASDVKEVSILQFAKSIGVSHTAVNKAIAAKKFVTGYNPKTKKINPTKAKADDWVQQQGIVKPKAGISRAKAIEKLSGVSEQGNEGKTTGLVLSDDELDEMDADELQARLPVSSTMPLHQAMRYREIIALALDKIKLRKETGALLDKDKVNTALFTFGRAMRDALLLIPKRISADIMAARNEIEVSNIIEDEIKQALNHFAKMMVEKGKS